MVENQHLGGIEVSSNLQWVNFYDSLNLTNIVEIFVECDLGLIIGTFYHGLSNYKAIFADETLPFARKIANCGDGKDDSKSLGNFTCIAEAATTLFRDALSRSKQTNEKERKVLLDDRDDATKSGDETNVNDNKDNNEILSEEVTVSKTSRNTSDDTKPESISLRTLAKKVRDSLANQSQNDDGSSITKKSSLPSSHCLDTRLVYLVGIIQKTERVFNNIHLDEIEPSFYNKSEIDKPILKANHAISQRLFAQLDLAKQNPRGPFEYLDISYYNVHDIESWTCMTTPKECRGLAIPSVITRHGLSAIVYSSDYTIDKVITLSTSHPSTSPSTNYSRYGEIPAPLKDDHQLRNSLCAALLCCGMPNTLGQPTAAAAAATTTPTQNSFQIANLLDVASTLIKRNIYNLISIDDVTHYINDILLPHCLQLCLFGKDFGIGSSSTSSTKHNNNNTNNIIEQFISNQDNIILPDPLCDLNQHSLSSMDHAITLLRRNKLLQSIQFIMNTCTTCNSNATFTQDDVIQWIRECSQHHNHSKNSMPTLWWYPEIHDYALLQYVYKYGLFSRMIIDHHRNNDNQNQSKDKDDKDDDDDVLSQHFQGTSLDPSQLKLHLRKFLLEGCPVPTPIQEHHQILSQPTTATTTTIQTLIPKHFLSKLSQEDIENFVNEQIQSFSLFLSSLSKGALSDHYDDDDVVSIMEKRLNCIISFICLKIDKNKDSGGGDDQGDNDNKEEDDILWKLNYYDLPMFG